MLSQSAENLIICIIAAARDRLGLAWLGFPSNRLKAMMHPVII